MAVSLLAPDFSHRLRTGPATAAGAVFIHAARHRAAAVLGAFENLIANFSSIKAASKKYNFSLMYK